MLDYFYNVDFRNFSKIAQIVNYRLISFTKNTVVCFSHVYLASNICIRLYVYVYTYIYRHKHE